jgi:type I restriction-modification system DNA methylase subunit
MGRSTVHYADSDTNNILKKLHNKLRPAGTPVQRVEYIIELLLLRIFEVKLKQDPEFKDLRKLFTDQNEDLLFSSLYTVANERLLPTLNEKFFPFYATILSEARKVYQKNLGQKVQDQLVLIAEVFKNSNFTNNVKSGNLQEVLGLVGELDEERLLKTDLLGDAIESALSETGGTKDIGLHRTPDHIRHFMVALAAPTFDDTIYDPACGTAGFLFDSFGYVIEGVKQEGEWPGQKAHPELRDFFKKYFVKRPVKMPSQEKAITFYRTGIFGTEYLGMIRKMAAINFYIRGLNPQNIEQGDSLAAFDPARDAGTRTVVLANPPFGAERDQEAYPNVWEEFSRESETTILFVKLMLDALAPGGRCAVIVSEGFLTWDQTSARNLRKMLIEEANLKAVISLPQGVFVSKGGVGPKTSILFFEKGGPTKEVWFYKVTNDGYTMGTNRRPIEGCQLVEALKLFDKNVRYGKTPPETKHSFSVPADWILALDPRVKQRIEAETTADFGEKEAAERAKLADKLADQVKQDNLTETERGERLTQHAEIWKNKTLNEIAKRIEKAQLYLFNLPNFRSNLSKSQLEEWDQVFKGAQRRNAHSLDERFAALRDCLPEKAHSALALLNVKNALEFDIARQYLMGYPLEELEKHNQLAELRKIIETGAKYPRCILGELLEPKYERIKKDDFDGQYDIIEKISFADGQIHIRELPETGMDLYLADKGDVITSKINVHQGAIALSPRRLACSTHYQVYRTTTPDCRGDYLVHILRSPQFLLQLLEQKNKGIKNEQGSDFLLSFEIPSPLPEVQAEIARQLDAIEKASAGCQAVVKNFSLHIYELETHDCSPIGSAVIDTKNGWSPKCNGGDLPVLTLSCLKNGSIDLSERKYTNAFRSDLEAFLVQEGDFFFSRGNTPELVALAGIAETVSERIVFPDLLTRVRFNRELILPEYAVLLFNSSLGRAYFGNVPQGASPSMVKVSQKYMIDFPVSLLGNIEAQAIIVSKYELLLASVRALAGVRTQSEESRSYILEGVWR